MPDEETLVAALRLAERERDVLDRSHKDLAHRLADAGREIERLRAAFIGRLAAENECYAWRNSRPKPCDAVKCGCLLEMQSYVDEQIRD